MTEKRKATTAELPELVLTFLTTSERPVWMTTPRISIRRGRASYTFGKWLEANTSIEFDSITGSRLRTALTKLEMRGEVEKTGERSGCWAYIDPEERRARAERDENREIAREAAEEALRIFGNLGIEARTGLGARVIFDGPDALRIARTLASKRAHTETTRGWIALEVNDG